MYMYYNTYIRWLKEFKVSLASERKLRMLAKEVTGDNLTSEEAVFSFPLDGGGEEIRVAPFVYVPNLITKVTDRLQENERYDGTIPYIQ